MGAQPLFLWIAGTCESSLKGEFKALISAALISVSQNVSQLPTVYSDHLQSICLIEDIQSNTLPPNFQVYQPARSLYWWLKSVLPHILDTVFQHIKASSSTFDPASQLNHIADAAATTAHYQPSYFSLWSPSGLPTKDSLSLFHSFHLLSLSDQLSHHLFSIPVSEQTHFISSCFSDQLSCHLFFNCSQQTNSFHLLLLF